MSTRKHVADRAMSPAPSTSASPQTQSELPPIVNEVLRSPGQPLAPSTRAFMDSRFGHDFGDVRVHADAPAAESARAVNAAAFTVGRDLVFGANRYAPETGWGRELLGHELAHTVQQRDGGAAPPPDRDGPIETSAAAAGRAVTQGRPVAGPLPAAGVGLSRAPDDDEDTAKLQAAFDDTELATEIGRLTEQLKTPHYPGRNYDAQWLAQLRAEAARRHPVTAPSRPSTGDPARDAAIAEAEAAAARIDADETDDTEPPARSVAHAEDALFYNVARPDDFAAVVPQVEVDRRIQTKSAAAEKARQDEEDRKRPFRILGLRDMFTLHHYNRDDVAHYLRQLPARDLQVLRKYGLGPPTATGYHNNVLKAAEAYIAAEVSPQNDPGNALVETQLADSSVVTTQQKYLKLEERRAQARVTLAKMEGVTHSGPVSLVGRVIGSSIAAATGHDPLTGGEWGAAFGELGDVASPFVAEAFRSETPAEAPGPAPEPAAEVRPLGENEPAPTPDPWAGAAVEPPTPTREPARPQLLLPETTGASEPPMRDPAVIRQEEVVSNREAAVEAATERVNMASRRVADAESSLAAAQRAVDEAREAADQARADEAQARTTAAGEKRGSPAAKEVTAKRNAADAAQRAAVRVERALTRTKQALADARKGAVTQTERASNAREALKTSRRQLEHVASGQAGPRRELQVVQPPREVTGPSGRTITDPGYEGRRRDDPPLGLMRNTIFEQTGANYRRMLNGQPPIGVDGGPVNLHHRTRGPMSRLDEYTETQHRELPLHEPGLDSEIDRQEFDRQRERYWVSRARGLLDRR